MHPAHMSHKHAHTFQQVFQHPPTHNLEWHDVLAMIRESGTVHEQENGRLTCTLNGVSADFHPAHGKKTISDIQQVLDVRHFLEKAGFHKDGSIAPAEQTAENEEFDENKEHAHDHGTVNAEHNQRAEQKIKTQESEQNDRSGFMPGDSQAHQQGNRQK